jgi:VRR-NUC domain
MPAKCEMQKVGTAVYSKNAQSWLFPSKNQQMRVFLRVFRVSISLLEYVGCFSSVMTAQPHRKRSPSGGVAPSRYHWYFDDMARPLALIEQEIRELSVSDKETLLRDSSTVRYVENGLIAALFGLLCWPAIFAPVPGAFFHDFHHGPIDLESGHFYRRRRSEFEDCLSHSDSGGYRKVIWRAFKDKWGIQSPFVRWHRLDKILLQWALDCFPSAHLRLWFDWIIRDVKENRAGFPDLVQFYPEERRYRMIEVKGPGDRVQNNQRRLLEYCVARGMPVAVCYVRWAD